MAETQQVEWKTTPEKAETKLETTDIGKTTAEEERKQQEEVSPEILAREATTVLAALSTPAKPKGKRKR